MFTNVKKLRDTILAKNYRWFETGQLNLNIVGVRTLESESNKFDDFLLVAYKGQGFEWILKQYAITTDPGKPWLLKPMDPGGCAVLVPGQYPGAYMVGIHGRSKPADRRYEALEQVAKMTYVRDNTKDSRIDRSLYADPDKRFRSILKTNIHRASRWAITRAVETYSAGCQVFQDPREFEEFMAICRAAAKIHGNRFTYTLLEETDFSV
jgi:hypothetical protein